jgi:Domain of unknown function (DUF6089)
VRSIQKDILSNFKIKTMRLCLRKGIIIVLFLAGLPAYLFCQRGSANYELGASLGLFVYQGDLTPSRLGSFRTQKPGLNLFANRVLSRSFSLRTNLTFSKLKGDDGRYSNPEFRKQRNFNFTSSLVEISESIAWNPFGNDDEHTISPYLMAGLGFSFLHIKKDWSRFNSEYFGNAPEVLNGLVADGQHSLPGGVLVVPVGFGLRHSLSRRLSVSAEAAYRLTFTDYLDGFSRAANPGKDDHYSSYSVGVIYKLGKPNKLNCPVMRN